MKKKEIKNYIFDHESDENIYLDEITSIREINRKQDNSTNKESIYIEGHYKKPDYITDFSYLMHYSFDKAKKILIENHYKFTEKIVKPNYYYPLYYYDKFNMNDLNKDERMLIVDKVQSDRLRKLTEIAVISK